MFLTKDGSGLASRIKKHVPNEEIVIEHLGVVANGEENYDSEEARDWKGALEIYRVKSHNGKSELNIELEIGPDWLAMMEKMWDDALPLVNELSEAAVGKPFIITRTFDAPREEVYKAWTEKEQMAKWWGPSGFKIDIKEMEVKPGGKFHYKMENEDGDAMWGRFAYRSILAPERIVFINSFSEENGGITRAPFDENWPLEMLNILRLEEENGKTKMTLQGAAVNATREERNTYEEGFENMQEGFRGTFDKLDAHLKRVRG
ncbi:MAG: SRPBCC domain-containing protein [Bacteroidia bacterium]